MTRKRSNEVPEAQAPRRKRKTISSNAIPTHTESLEGSDRHPLRMGDLREIPDQLSRERAENPTCGKAMPQEGCAQLISVVPDESLQTLGRAQDRSDKFKFSQERTEGEHGAILPFILPAFASQTERHLSDMAPGKGTLIDLRISSQDHSEMSSGADLCAQTESMIDIATQFRKAGGIWMDKKHRKNAREDGGTQDFLKGLRAEVTLKQAELSYLEERNIGLSMELAMERTQRDQYNARWTKEKENLEQHLNRLQEGLEWFRQAFTKSSLFPAEPTDRCYHIRDFLQVLTSEASIGGKNTSEIELLVAAIQVSVEFICDGSFPCKEMTNMLQISRTWAIPILKSMECLVGEFLYCSWRVDNVRATFNLLLGILRKQGDADVMTQLHKTLLQFCQDDLFLAVPETLRELTELLYQPESSSLQNIAAAVIAKLACGRDLTKREILDSPALLDKLVQFISGSISEDEDSNLQVEAARALRGLTCTADSNILKYLATFPGLTDSLRESLVQLRYTEVQICAVEMLVKLNAYTETIDFDDLLCKLARFLANDASSDLQGRAASALWSLAEEAGADMLERMAKFPQLMDSLGDLLVNGRHPKNRNFAAEQMLERLGKHMDRGKFDELVRKLVQSVANDGQPDDQMRVVSILGGFSWRSNVEMWERMAHFPYMLDNVGALLSKNQNPQLQVKAALALHRLLGTKDEKFARVVKQCPDLLEKLLQSIANDDNSGLQEEAARVLERLISKCMYDTTLLLRSARVQNICGVLGENLIRSCGDVQYRFADTLCRLGRLDGSVKLHIMRSSNLLESLSQALAQERVGKLKLCAARVIRRWSDTMDASILREFANFPYLLERLQESVNSGDGDLGEMAAWALANLASATETSRLQVVNFFS